MHTATYLVFGRSTRPAFKLARTWSREHQVPLEGLLQVGDVGAFSDPSHCDEATKRNKAKSWGHVQEYARSPSNSRGSVGVLTWNGSAGDFSYLDPVWLRTVTRHNWRHR